MYAILLQIKNLFFCNGPDSCNIVIIILILVFLTIPTKLISIDILNEFKSK